MSARPPSRRLALRPASLAGLACVLAAGLLRFSGLDWDGGQVYHSDEVTIAEAALRIDIPRQMDPDLYVYNAVPVYLDAEVARLVAWVTGDPAWKTALGRMALVARGISALASTAAVALTLLLGRRLLGDWGGVLAAAFQAFCPGLVQAAHYGVTESLLVAFFLALALVSAGAGESPEPWSAGRTALAALIAGLAIGTKTSALSFLLLPAAAWLFSLKFVGVGRTLKTAALFSVGTALTFVLVSPYSLVHFDRLSNQMAYENAVIRGTQVTWYTAPFLRSVNYVYEAGSLIWLCGPLIAVLGLAGAAGWLVSAVRDPKRRGGVPILVFSLLYFAYVGSWSAKFVRYLVPLLPVLCLAAAWLLTRLAESRRWRIAAVATGSLAVLSSAAFSLAILSIYLRPHTRLAASDWIYSNVPAGSTIAREQLDPPLPAVRYGKSPDRYVYRSVPCLQHDDAKKVEEIAKALAGADLLVVSSRRCVDAIRYLSPIYPMTNHYYSRLLDGTLGFSPIHRFASYPTVAGWVIRDEDAEPTFRVFDHPTVLVFGNRGRLSMTELERRLALP